MKLHLVLIPFMVDIVALLILIPAVWLVMKPQPHPLFQETDLHRRLP